MQHMNAHRPTRLHGVEYRENADAPGTREPATVDKNLRVSILDTITSLIECLDLSTGSCGGTADGVHNEGVVRHAFLSMFNQLFID